MNKKSQTEELIRYLEEIRDEEGYAVVNVNLRDGAALYDPLCMPDQLDLDSGIYDYIEAQTNVVPAGIPLKIRFHGDVPLKEQEKIGKAMKRHYTLKALDISWDVAANFRKMLFLALFGAAVLAVYFYFAFASDQVLFTEILSIVGSFSLWEAADALLLERPRLRREHRNVEQNLNQKIEFIGSAR